MTVDDQPWSDADTALVSRVAGQLAECDPLGVAFSGGVDSAVLAALAARTLGAQQELPIIGVSPSLAEYERTLAHDVARFIGGAASGAFTLPLISASDGASAQQDTPGRW